MNRDMRMKLYISGPLTDKQTGKVTEENVRTFHAAERLLRQVGYRRIVNPTRVWVCRWPWLYAALKWLVGEAVAYRLVLLYDLWLLMRCNRIYKLEGWKESRGANIESCVAYHCSVFPIVKKMREKIDYRLAEDMNRRDAL